MIKFHDPFRILIEAVEALYDIRVKICFDPSIRKFLWFGGWGVTIYPNDKSIPIIKISPHLPVKHAIEIMAHEIAHVVVGIEEGHGEKWEKAFSDIHRAYIKFNEELYGTSKAVFD